MSTEGNIQPKTGLILAWLIWCHKECTINDLGDLHMNHCALAAGDTQLLLALDTPEIWELFVLILFSGQLVKLLQGTLWFAWLEFPLVFYIPGRHTKNFVKHRCAILLGRPLPKPPFWSCKFNSILLRFSATMKHLDTNFVLQIFVWGHDIIQAIGELIFPYFF